MSTVPTNSSKPSTPGIKGKKNNNLGVSVSNMSPSSGGIDSPGGAIGSPLPEMNLPEEFQLTLKLEDFEILDELGAGNGGTVNLVKHTPTNKIMARK
ncbi:MAP kinase kinase (MEK), partial [Nowakowskiella sp. JEL0078]